MSSMDSENEEKILTSLKKFKADTTTITMSHRLSAVVHAEKGYYLKGANEMAAGTLQSLLRNNQDFIRFFAGQGQ